MNQCWSLFVSLLNCENEHMAISDFQAYCYNLRISDLNFCFILKESRGSHVMACLQELWLGEAPS